jgi:hypothetical protein
MEILWYAGISGYEGGCQKEAENISGAKGKSHDTSSILPWTLDFTDKGVC